MKMMRDLSASKTYADSVRINMPMIVPQWVRGNWLVLSACSDKVSRFYPHARVFPFRETRAHADKRTGAEKERFFHTRIHKGAEESSYVQHRTQRIQLDAGKRLGQGIDWTRPASLWRPTETSKKR